MSRAKEKLNMDLASESNFLNGKSANKSKRLKLFLGVAFLAVLFVLIFAFPALVYANNTATGVRSFTLDTLSPNVTLVYPANGSTLTTVSANFTYNVTDDYGVDNCTLYLNGTKNNTDTSITSGVNSTINVTLYSGVFNWTVKCYDTAGNFNSSGNFSFTISLNQAPNITLINISPATAYTNDTLNCSGTYSDANSDKGNVSIAWYNGSTQYSTATILNVDAGALVSNATLSGIQAKGETWNCTINATDAQGLAGNPNSTTRTISNFVPNVPEIGGPENASRTIGNSQTLRCANSTDADGDTVNYAFYMDTNTPSTTLRQNSTTTTYAFATNDGWIYYWRCKAEDGVGGVSAFTAQKTFTENSLPSVVTLVYPLVNQSTTNRTPTFNWSASTDAENDNLIYEVNASCFPSCSADNKMFNSSANQNWTLLTSRLRYFWDDLYYYNWTVRVWDGYEVTAWATPRNFTLASSVTLNLITSSVNFSTLSLGQAENTTTDTPAPLVIQNDGNSFADINISIFESDWLWAAQPQASIYYRYKIDNYTGELGAFNWTGSQTAWADVPASNTAVIDFFNYTDATDSAEIDVYVEVPPGEGAGTKSSQIVFTGWYAREL